jgi:hypothetical protein
MSAPRTSASWQRLDLSGITARLETARDLLRQAAALAATQDAGTLAAMAELQQRRADEEGHGLQRRRYR